MSTATLQQVPTGTYNVDPVHSSFGFAVKPQRSLRTDAFGAASRAG